MTLYFTNPGELDPQVLTLMGFSAKPGPSPIGMFGTGLKYAIAGVLRLGGSIEIWIGTRQFTFRTRNAEIRGQLTERVDLYLNGEPNCALPFTTAYGQAWEPWMLYRELWANAKDEGGQVGEMQIHPAEGLTIVAVSCSEIEEAHSTRASFILESVPLLSLPGLELHENNFSSSVYYQGLKVLSLPANHSPAWTYNITGPLSLSEDRTASSYAVHLSIMRALMVWAEEETSPLEACLESHGLEESFDWHWGGSGQQPSRTFLQTVARLRNEGRLARDSGLVKWGSSHEGYEFVYSECPATDREAALLEEVSAKLAAAGLEGLPELGVSEDIDQGDQKQFSGGKLLFHPSALVDDGWELANLLVEWWLENVKYLCGDKSETWLRKAWLREQGFRPKAPVETREEEEMPF